MTLRAGSDRVADRAPLAPFLDAWMSTSGVGWPSGAIRSRPVNVSRPRGLSPTRSESVGRTTSTTALVAFTVAACACPPQLTLSARDGPAGAVRTPLGRGVG